MVRLEDSAHFVGTKIHPTALVDPGAKLGKNVEVGPFCIVEKGVEIGDNVKIGPRCTIHEGSIIGDSCTLNEGVIIGMEPQDLKYKGESTRTIIGRNTQFREYSSVERGTLFGDGSTQVGSDCLIMAYSHVAHDSKVGDRGIVTHGAGLAGHVTVEDRAIIGAMAGVHQFCRIGEMAMIGGMAKITGDVPPYLLVDGNPAGAVGLNSIGLRRNGLGPKVRSELKKAFRILYREGLTRSKAIEKIAESLEMYPEVQHFLNFVEQSKRGICPSRSGVEGGSED